MSDTILQGRYDCQKLITFLFRIHFLGIPKNLQKTNHTGKFGPGLEMWRVFWKTNHTDKGKKISNHIASWRSIISNLIGSYFSLGIVTGFLGNQSHFQSWASQPKVIWPWPSWNKVMWRVFWETNHKPYLRFGWRQPNDINLQSSIPLKNIWWYFCSTAMGKLDAIFGAKKFQTQQMSNTNWCFSSSHWASFCRVAEKHIGSTEHCLTV